MLPHLTAIRRPGDATVIDFGCGDGRYGRRLVAAGLEVQAVDVAPKRVALAHAAAPAAMTVHLIERGVLPFADSSIDGLFTNVVLLHIPDSEFEATTAELRRVLKSDALLLMCENTTLWLNRTSHTGHVVFRSVREYMNAFPGAEAAAHFALDGERDTIFAGRLRK